MTLNTFHYAGVSAKSNVTRCIPILDQIASRYIKSKSPSTKIVIFEKEEFNKCKSK